MNEELETIYYGMDAQFNYMLKELKDHIILDKETYDNMLLYKEKIQKENFELWSKIYDAKNFIEHLQQCNYYENKRLRETSEEVLKLLNGEDYE